jgi:predicted transcriptional regulator
LNFTIIDRFLSELLDRALIEVKDKLYETTDKGITFLHHYEELGK